MTQTIRIYLAWQRIKDGRVQIRRWSPDRAVNSAQNKYVFLGYERQSVGALLWLGKAGEPTWPECVHADVPPIPYEVISDECPSIAAYKPKAEHYVAAEKFK